MTLKLRYERKKKALLADKSICAANRLLFKEFFEYEEYKLRRTNQLPALDDGCYKTLCGYIARFLNVNEWFNNKPWNKLTKEDIKLVYDDLEDGKITNRHGLPFKDRRSYYNKILKSKPFRLAGKAEMSKEVIEYYTDRQEKEVHFLDEANFLKMASVLSKPTHLLLFWLAWDIGENINTLLKLTKRDFTRQIQQGNQEAEYLVHLTKEKLKRSRTPRSEPTLYPQTVNYADIVLGQIDDDDLVFPFGYRQALKILDSTSKRSAAMCLPNKDKVRWKDFRSGMACHLLKQGWTTDEVNFRLGHKPSSREIDVYISHLAIDRRKPKIRLQDGDSRMESRNQVTTSLQGGLIEEQFKQQTVENAMLKAELQQTQRDIQAIQTMIRQLVPQAALAV